MGTSRRCACQGGKVEEGEERQEGQEVEEGQGEESFQEEVNRSRHLSRSLKSDSHRSVARAAPWRRPLFFEGLDVRERGGIRVQLAAAILAALASSATANSFIN